MQTHAIMLLGPISISSRGGHQSRTTMDVYYFPTHDPHVRV